jgi:hypothetical protein
MRHRSRASASLVLALLLAGCTAAGDPGRPSAGTPAPTTTTTTIRPPIVADDGPATNPEPLTALRGTVALPAPDGAAAVATGAVGTADGGAHVLVTPSNDRPGQSLVTVDGRYAVTGAVPLPGLGPAWDVHLLPDGRVLISGEFRTGVPGYGFVAIDPVTGRAQRSLVIPFEEGTSLANGRSVLSPDGATVYLLLGTYVEERRLSLLVAADVATGRLLGGRDLFEEVRAASTTPISPFSIWLFARPDGGAAVLFDALPRDTFLLTPTLLRYDAALEPTGAAVFLTDRSGNAETQAAAEAGDGTLVVSTEVQNGHRLLVLPPGGREATPLLDLPGRTFDYALTVEPALGWALLPDRSGARAVDLATGGVTPVDLRCGSGLEVRDLVPAARGDGGALIIGRCDDPRPGTPMVWFTGP